MPLQTASVGDTVQYRNAKGHTRNVTVSGVQAAAPGAGAWSVANSGTGGTLTAATYSYRITAVNGGAESAPATAKTTVVGAGTTNKCTITLPGGTSAYRIYGRVGGSELLIGTTAVGATTFDDTGSVTPAGAQPTADARIGMFQPDGGLSNGAVGMGAVKATAMKGAGSTNKYFKR